MRSSPSSSRPGGMLLVGAIVLLGAVPLSSWGQAAPPKPLTPPGLPAAVPAAPAAMGDSAARAAAAAASAEVAKFAAPLSDSTRTALKAEIERELKTAADSLKLTPEQRAQARPILLDQAYQVRALRDKYAKQERTQATADAMRKDIQAIREATDNRLSAVLTVQQMNQFKAKREEWLGRTRTRMGMPGMVKPAAPATPPAATPAAVDTTKK